MRTIPLTHPIRQMFLALAGFVAVVALLECDGLASWANHLEIGMLRTVAVPVTGGMQKTLRPAGLGILREHALNSMARIGWTDDAAELASAAKAAGAGDKRTASTCVAANLPSVPLQPAVGGATPLASDVPRTTALAPLPPVGAGKPRVVALAGDSMMAVG